ncbi:hypothetical protein KGV71_001750 [Campylobacter coli]|nr:hypothetical protein [Campylobacter coli]
MTKTQAFVDGFVGKPIKNECFNLWDLNAIIREKQANSYLNYKRVLSKNTKYRFIDNTRCIKSYTTKQYKI